MDRNAILEMIESDRATIVSLCCDLVRIPSADPPGDTTSVAEYIISLLEAKGLSYKIYAPQAHMPNIVAVLKGKEQGKRLILNGHMDTYGAGDHSFWDRDPFGGDLEDGKIYGRGTSDMKAGVTASIMTFLYSAEHWDRSAGELVLSLTSDEETGGKWGAIWLLENVPEMQSGALLNGEPSGTELVTFGEKGVLRVAFKARGRAAHAAYAHLGENAINKMNQFLSQIIKIADMEVEQHELSGVYRHAHDAIDRAQGAGSADHMGSVMVNVGVIEGGYIVNLVPEECRAEVDIRIPPGVKTEKILEEIEKVRLGFEGVDYEILFRIEPLWTPLDDELVQSTLRNAAVVKGGEVFLNCSLAASDCCYFREKGISAVIYGPQPYYLGAPNEFIMVEDLIDTVKVHALTALEYLGQPE